MKKSSYLIDDFHFLSLQFIYFRNEIQHFNEILTFFC